MIARLPSVLIGLGLLAVVGWQQSAWRSPGGGDSAAAVVRRRGEAPDGEAPERSRPSDRPFALRRHYAPRVTIDAGRVRFVTDRMRPTAKTPLSGILHAQMVFGASMPLPGAAGERATTLGDVLRDDAAARRYFGDSVFTESRFGLRCRYATRRDLMFAPSAQAHWGQLLCELGRHGIPLGHPLFGPPYDVRSLLDDGVANYSPADPELEWTAVAFALYLPPEEAWVNKFGERTTFSDLAEDLMKRRPVGEPSACFGLHVEEALAVLLQVDGMHGILTAECRRRLAVDLRRRAAAAVGSQLADGGWHAGRTTLASADEAGALAAVPLAPEAAAARAVSRVHVTGHQLGWLLLLPADMAPPDDVFQRGADFLLQELIDAPPARIDANYCPFVHAAHVLQVLTAPASANADASELGRREAIPRSGQEVPHDLAHEQ